jgi:hypothetical protein
MQHGWGVVGLLVNVLGTIGLLRFSPNPFEHSTLTRDQLASVAPQFLKKMRNDQRIYRLSVALLMLGFFLQLIDLLLE